MQTIRIKPHGQFGTAVSILTTSSGTYICPGWYPVPFGTTVDQVEFEIDHSIKTTVETYKADSSTKPGKFYEVKQSKGTWSCSCASGSWRRGDCKHIKGIKTKLRTENSLA